MLKGKVALVTGASRGIGKAVAIKLAQAGATVIINYMGNAMRAEEVVEEINSFGGNSLKIQADVSNSEQVEKMIKNILERFPRIDILVNNAGITKDQLILRMKEEDFDNVISVNLKGVFLVSKAVSRQMFKQKSGKIVNITSIVGIIGNQGQANYVASKAGVIGLTKTMAKEFAARNINVNAIAPGFIETDMTQDLSDDLRDLMLKEIPLGYFGKPEDVANLVEFLVSEKAKYITGQVINIDGGMVM